jgi:DNA-binding Xre family transcriptional regulator
LSFKRNVRHDVHRLGSREFRISEIHLVRTHFGDRESQQQLADLSGIHRNYVSDVENARNACLVNILRLCTALGVAPRELFRPWD